MGSWDKRDADVMSDIVAIPRPDATFDAILCTEVLEHVSRSEVAQRHVLRALSGWIARGSRSSGSLFDGWHVHARRT